MRSVLPALLACVLAAALHSGRLDRPLEQSLASSSTTYMVRFFRNWDEAGFLATRGLPAVVPGAGELRSEPYLHHPPGAYWLMYGARLVFGWKEWAFRLVPFLATVAAAGLAALLGARLAGTGGALLAGTLFPVIPLTFAFGLMPNSDPLVVALLAGGFLLHLRQRERPTPLRRALFLGCFLAGCLIEWQAWFLLPAVALFEATRPAGERRPRDVLRMGVACGAALVLVLGWAAWALGSLEVLAEDVRATVAATWRGRPDHTAAGFLLNQLGVWVRFVGWPLILVTLGLLGAALLRPSRLRSLRGGTLLALALPAFLAVGLFRTPAYDHPFFWMPLLAFLPPAAAVAWRALEPRRPVLAALLVVALFASCAWRDVVYAARTETTEFRELARLVNRVAAREDLVVTPEPVGPTMFYTEAHFFGSVRDPWILEQIIARREEGRAAFDRLFVWMYESSRGHHPGLVRWLESESTTAVRAEGFPGVLCWVIRP